MKTDVLVVGGGLTGCLSALMLADEGVDALLIDAGVLNGRASGANAGSIHLQIPFPEFVSLGENWARQFAEVLPMMRDSVGLWREVAARLGVDIELKSTGGLLVARTDEQMRQVRAKAAIEQAAGIPITLLDRDEVSSLAPYICKGMIGGALCPLEGKANPLIAGPAIAAAIRTHGLEVREGCTLTGLERAGARWRAQTTGGVIEARAIVNAAGADAGRLAAMAGLDLEIEGWPIQATVTERVAPMVDHLVYSAAGKLTLKQLANGTMVIGGGWPSARQGDGGLGVNPFSLAANMKAAADVVPAMAGARAVRTWPAIVNGTADWRPVIGEVSGRQGFFMALFPWMGFTAAPITARTVADLVVGRVPPIARTLLLAA
ncbi:MAG: FAD-binding oxidoreductase [Pseudomonadota bacterium]